jgi:hypothetical protein
MAKRHLSEVVGVRLSRKGLRKLDHLATITFRTRGDIVRALIDQATFAGQPDLILQAIDEKDQVPASQ